MDCNSFRKKRVFFSFYCREHLMPSMGQTSKVETDLSFSTPDLYTRLVHLTSLIICLYCSFIFCPILSLQYTHKKQEGFFFLLLHDKIPRKWFCGYWLVDKTNKKTSTTKDSAKCLEFSTCLFNHPIFTFILIKTTVKISFNF